MYAKSILIGITLFFFATAVSAMAADGDFIEDVRVLSIESGLESVYAEKITDAILERTGNRMNKAKIDSVLGDLFDKKIVSDYKIGIMPGKRSGIILIIQVRENFEVRSVKFFGVKELKENEVSGVTFTRVGQPLSEALIQKDAASIERLYKEDGYLFVNVSTPREGYADGIVIFLVEEGPKVVIKKISFNGNHMFSDKKLKSKLTIKPRKMLGLLGKGVYNKEQLARDVERIANYYRSEGYLNVLVGVEKIEYSTDRSEMYITIYIEEGEQFQVGKITFAGNKYFTAEEFKSSMALKEGGTFKISHYQNDLRKIRTMYTSRAYIDVVIGRDNRDVVVTYHHSEPVVDLHFDIVENSEVYIGNILIRGNTVTQEKVVRRELSFGPMEKFNYEQIVASRNRLLRLGGMQDPYFKAAEIEVDPNGQTRIVDGKMVRDIIVQLKETESFGRIRLAAGLSSDQGLIGEIALIRTNFDLADLPKSFKDMFVDRTAFLGAGQNLEISVSPGMDVSRFRITFEEPYMFGKPLSFGVSLYQWDWGRDSYDEIRAGINLSFGRRLTREWVASMRLRVQSINVDNIDNDAAPDIVEVEGKNSLVAVRFSLVRDVRKIDRMFKPYAGQRTFLVFEPVLGDFSLFKVSFGTTRYRTVHVDEEGLLHILKLHTEIGLIFGDDSPIYERYYLGGTGNMRGFDYRGLGPHQNDDPVGGDTMVFSTIEYTFPILGDTIRGAIFTDVGTVNEGVGDFGSVRMSVGFGVRIFSPQIPIPITIDFGLPIMKEDDDDTQIVSFSMSIGY